MPLFSNNKKKKSNWTFPVRFFPLDKKYPITIAQSSTFKISIFHYSFNIPDFHQFTSLSKILIFTSNLHFFFPMSSSTNAVSTHFIELNPQIELTFNDNNAFIVSYTISYYIGRDPKIELIIHEQIPNFSEPNLHHVIVDHFSYIWQEIQHCLKNNIQRADINFILYNLAQIPPHSPTNDLESHSPTPPTINYDSDIEILPENF